MQKTFKHWLPLLLSLCLVFLPVTAAHGQSQRQYDRDYVPEYDVSDVRSQDYLRDVVELASTLGSAHAVRLLCNGRDDQYWRVYMQELLSVEAPFQSRLRTSMVDAFNSGYRSTNQRHRVCDEAAVTAEKTFAQTGRQLADTLAAANLPDGARRGAAGQ